MELARDTRLLLRGCPSRLGRALSFEPFGALLERGDVAPPDADAVADHPSKREADQATQRAGPLRGMSVRKRKHEDRNRARRQRDAAFALIGDGEQRDSRGERIAVAP